MIGEHLDNERLLATEPLTFGGPIVGSEETFQVQFLVNDPRATIAYEAFAGNSTVNWAFWHDEVHVIMGGEAEVTYTLGPNHRRQVTKRFGPGDTYLIPDGTRATFRILSDEPYLHVCVIMPRFEYSKDERTDAYE
jgi:mannose-6-phosphate isomerase-like protein (cupin superfamily)